MLLVAPAVLWDVGFQLSLLATAGLIWFGAAVERRLPALPAWIREPVALTLAAQITTLPVILVNFERLSIVAPLANELVVPFVPVAMLFSALASLAGMLDAAMHLPCIGDGRQSGTSGSPSIVNASPEAAAGGGLALLETGDRVRIDLNKGTANILVSKTELTMRRAVLERAGGYQVPNSQTPWQEMHRASVEQLSEGMALKPALKYQRIAQKTTPRDSH